MMEKMQLYTAERGVVRRFADNEVVSFNINIPNSSFYGMIMRKDVLLNYLTITKQVLFTCLCGDKHIVVDHIGLNWRYFTGCYGIEANGTLLIPSQYHEVKEERRSTAKTEFDDDFLYELKQRYQAKEQPTKKLTKAEKRHIQHKLDKKRKKMKKNSNR